MADGMNFRIDPAEAQKMLNGEGAYGFVADDLMRRGEAVLRQAVSTAPVKTGNYRNGLAVKADHTDRLVVRVVATAPHSHIVEAATGNLNRALDAAGGD